MARKRWRLSLPNKARRGMFTIRLLVAYPGNVCPRLPRSLAVCVCALVGIVLRTAPPTTEPSVHERCACSRGACAAPALSREAKAKKGRSKPCLRYPLSQSFGQNLFFMRELKRNPFSIFQVHRHVTRCTGADTHSVDASWQLFCRCRLKLVLSSASVVERPVVMNAVQWPIPPSWRVMA